MGLLGIFEKKISGAKNLKLGKILGGSQNSIFPKYLDLGTKIAKKNRQPLFFNLVAHCLARLFENPFVKSLRALQSKWTTLIFFGGVPPPHPNSVEGHFPGISCARRALSSGIKIVTQGLPNFEKIWGKKFHFWPPSGGTQNCIRGKLSPARANNAFSQLSKFCRNRSIDGRDIRGQTKVGFPGPAIKLERT